ncbi:MAG: D-alanyl-D-alanine carboxypeptidase family protein [Pyrinomonadaceae bacterium]|nr:D-alanyl-D-alanine carboxypeptidase family protein [Pyrinomonadaceae bacterium]
MNRFQIRITIFFIAIATSIAVVWLDASANRGAVKDARGATAGNDEYLEPIVPSPQSSSASQPAKRNELLRTDLNWTFGSKQQRGWYLYTPLINRLIDTKHEPASRRFASALARWQKKSGHMPSGVLDDETLYKMIVEWQGRRIKDRTPAQPGQLLTAPISDFYDPTRAEELRSVERNTYAAYKRMVAAAVAERSLGLARNPKRPRGELAAGEKYLKIISAFRSRAYQEKLRRESPNSGTAGLAVNSPHFTGRALDLYVGGDPVDTRDSNRAIQVQTRVYLWLVRNAERFGFRPYFYEPWHWEYVGKGAVARP